MLIAGAVYQESAMKRAKVAAIVTMGVIWAARALAEGSAGNDPILNQRRPQEETIVATPLPYREELVTFGNPAAAAVQLAGTLTLPQGTERLPAIVLIAGSGRNDRNEEVAGHKPLLVLADALTRQGYAVLRYDKRGVAKSAGDYSSATTLDFASDATAAVAYLKRRPDIDTAKVGLIGHSEGANIAATVAAGDPGLAFIVMLAGAAVPGKVLVAEQIRRIAIADGQTREAATRTFNLNRRLYDAIAASKDQREAEARVRKLLTSAKPQPTEAESHQAIHFTELPYMRFILAYDPTPTLTEVRVPVLALNGSKDLIGPPDLNLPALRKALTRDRDVTIVEMPGLNHFFQHAETGSPQEFAKIEETLAPEVLSLTSYWVVEHTR
jgi:pimeloyl-ACP methyl ester carboxylesterase